MKNVSTKTTSLPPRRIFEVWAWPRVSAVLFIAMLFGASSAAWANKTYEVTVLTNASSGVVGWPFLISGSITTDGTVGYLQASNIRDWSFDITIGTQPAASIRAGHEGDYFTCRTLSCGLNTDAAGNIYFDYADPHGGGAGGGAYFAATNGAPAVYFIGSPSFGALSVGNKVSGSYVYGYGNVHIGQVSAVPEPTSFSLFAVSLLFLGGLSRKGNRAFRGSLIVN